MHRIKCAVINFQLEVPTRFILRETFVPMIKKCNIVNYLSFSLTKLAKKKTKNIKNDNHAVTNSETADNF